MGPTFQTIESHDFANYPQATEIPERRSRPRLPTRTNGWVFMGDDDHAPAREVIITDVSREGVGFRCDSLMKTGMICRLRMGFGPKRLAKRIRIVRVTQTSTEYAVGAEFV